MDKIIFDNKILSIYEYSVEEEFEKVIVEHALSIFGQNTIYVDIKKKIGDSILTIPDGYLIDFTYSSAPQLYIIENELVTHDPYKHIGQQLLKFGISYKISGRKIKNFLLDYILLNENIKVKAEQGARECGYRNIDDFLDKLIFDKPIKALVVIDRINDDLEKVVNQLSMDIDIIEFQTFSSGSIHLHKFTPLHEEAVDIQDDIDVDELDTIVVPANEGGFNEVFLGEDCWYSIRISSAMLGKIKYIAVYQTAPVSAITYYAEVADIFRYQNEQKYKVNFTSKATKIHPPLRLIPKPNGRIKAPQAPRYTTFTRLMNAKNLDEVF
ncbi:hypothetical protein [Ruminiclostridium hungatei]|nr:hypothetical protein [Ruminiclostridium hungatei]